MTKRAVELVLVWLTVWAAVTGMAFWGLPSSNQTPMAARWRVANTP